MEGAGEIFVIPFFGQGHLNPSMELCRNISSHNFNVTLIIPSHLSSSIPSTFAEESPFIHVAHIPFASEPETGSGPQRCNPIEQNKQMGGGIKAFLSARSGFRPACGVIDVMMSWSKEIFAEFQIPVVSFFTSGAIFSALSYGRWKAKIGDLQPGETRELPGLPKEMAATYADLHGGLQGRPPERPNWPEGRAGPPKKNPFGPPPGLVPGQKPRWMDEVEGAVALLFNTCDRLERLFIDYIAEQTQLPVWGVGPLLPEKYWKSAGSILHDRDMRSSRKANYSEDEVFQWLESKPIGSVIYISFGSELGPSVEEYKELAKALEESTRPFIWVIQNGILKSVLGLTQTDSEEEEQPEGLDTIVGDRGMIITGWAPQLLILSHPSTGRFLSHCGWNSTVEAIGRGVPILGWPLRFDQFDNAKLVANHLNIGFVITSSAGEDGRPRMFTKDDIAAGVERLMSDEEVHKQAKELSKEFESGFPASSVNALDAFVEFISQKAT